MSHNECGHAVASEHYPYKLLILSFKYKELRFLTLKPSAVITPSLAPILVLHFSVYPCLKGPCPVLRDIAAEVGLLDHPHFMLPWLLCAHMLGDYGRPFKHPVDEIIRAL